jgi:hypothetical protein
MVGVFVSDAVADEVRGELAAMPVIEESVDPLQPGKRLNRLPKAIPKTNLALEDVCIGSSRVADIDDPQRSRGTVVEWLQSS